MSDDAMSRLSLSRQVGNGLGVVVVVQFVEAVDPFLGWPGVLSPLSIALIRSSAYSLM